MIVSGGEGSQTLIGTSGDDVIYGHSAADVDPLSGLITTTRVATGLDQPTFAGLAPGDANGVYVTEKDSGRVVRVDLTTGAQTTFLDMAVTPAVFFHFGRRAAEQSLARYGSDPFEPSGPPSVAQSGGA